MNYTFQFGDVFAAWPLLLKGTWNTIELSLLAMMFGLAVAIVCAWGKTAGPKPLRFVINAYIELIRNTPFLVQLFFFFFALPALGLRWSAYTAALTGAGHQPGRLRDRNHPRRHRVDSQGPDRSRPGAEPQAPRDFPLRHPQARAQGDLPGADQPVHPPDAQFGGGVGHFRRRPDLSGRQPAIANLSQLRDLHRRQRASTCCWRWLSRRCSA